MLMTHTLKHPITIDGSEVTKLSLRRPTVRDIKLSQRKANEIDQTIEMVAMLSEQKPDTIESLDAEDFTAIANELGKLMGGEAS